MWYLSIARKINLKGQLEQKDHFKGINQLQHYMWSSRVLCIAERDQKTNNMGSNTKRLVAWLSKQQSPANEEDREFDAVLDREPVESISDMQDCCLANCLLAKWHSSWWSWHSPNFNKPERSCYSSKGMLGWSKDLVELNKRQCYINRIWFSW